MATHPRREPRVGERDVRIGRTLCRVREGVLIQDKRRLHERKAASDREYRILLPVVTLFGTFACIRRCSALTPGRGLGVASCYPIPRLVSRPYPLALHISVCGREPGVGRGTVAASCGTGIVWMYPGCISVDSFWIHWIQPCIQPCSGYIGYVSTI